MSGRVSVRSVVLALVLVVASVSPVAADSISVVDSVGDVGPANSIVLDANGYPVVAYRDQGANNLKLVHCNDPDCVGGDESIVVADAAFGAARNDLELDSSGNPVIASYDFGDLVILTCTDPNCAVAAGITRSEPVATFNPHGSALSMVLDSSDFPVVSFIDNFTDDLQILHCNDTKCDGIGESVTTGATGDISVVETSIALDSSGNPVVAYMDTTAAELRLLRCDDPNCDGVGESIEVLDSIVTSSGVTMTLDASDNPVMLYESSTSGTTVLHCDDPNCAIGGGDSFESLPVLTNRVGEIRLDGSGFPVATFIRSNRLHVLHCDDANCAGGNDSIRIPDFASTFNGFFSSLTLDAAGNPVVAYNDGIDDDLKVLHCDDPLCDEPETWHVDVTAPFGGDGRTWTTAFRSLQDALAVAGDADTILIAEGTYRPAGTDRSISFEIDNDIVIEGGYQAGGLAGPDNDLYPTVLSGDLNGNDTATIETGHVSRADNSFHVVSIWNATPTVTIRELTIEGGNANGGGSSNNGAGLRMRNADVTLDEVDIVRNSAGSTGGLMLQSGSAALDRVLVDDNTSDGTGGGIGLFQNTSVVITNSRITNNRSAGRGAGISQNISDLDVISSVIDGNSAAADGGGIDVINNATIDVINSQITNNTALDGAGIANRGIPTVINATIADNTASGNGGGIHNDAGFSAVVTNTILWGNTAAASPQLSGAGFTTTYSDVEGGFAGLFNRDVDPLFVTPGSDYRLQPGTTIADFGLTSAVPADAQDVDGDGDTAERTPDLDLRSRVFGTSVAIGAHELWECDSQAITVDIGAGDVPTTGDDVILGTSGDDVINGLDGNDTICSEDGEDNVVGAGGNDTIFGGPNADRLSGNAGDDVIEGDDGADIVFSGSGDDSIGGGLGNDTLGGGSDTDTINGHEGDDTISGGSGNDGLISGGLDNDAVNGGGGNDSNVHGDDGDDSVSGNGGKDTVNGGDGDDTVRGGQNDDTVNGGPGDDFVAGNDGSDVCDGGTTNEIAGDTAAGNCETILNVP